MTERIFPNPFKPGAGHRPPFLAGRDNEILDFARILEQKTVLKNVILTGLRGVGKTVLLDEFRPMAIAAGWLWAGADLSESTSLSEERLAIRLLTDLSVTTGQIVVNVSERQGIGFGAEVTAESIQLDYSTLKNIYDGTPGLVSDKLKAVLLIASKYLPESKQGIVFAYDEAQNMSDHGSKEEYPLSLLLDVFQSLQKQGVPFLLVLAGLPTLFPKLVEARTFAERMFRVMTLDGLDEKSSKDAVTKPIESTNCPVKLDDSSIDSIVEISGGYPYFIQFICREVFDVFLQGQNSVPVDEIVQKLDSDFFAGRWARATDRQRDLMLVIAYLDECHEFTVQEVSEMSKTMDVKRFSASHVSQMLSTLQDRGLIYKNRYSKYCFAVPLLDRFIRRQHPIATVQ